MGVVSSSLDKKNRYPTEITSHCVWPRRAPAIGCGAYVRFSFMAGKETRVRGVRDVVPKVYFGARGASWFPRVNQCVTLRYH